MIPIIALVLGLASWFLLLYGIIRHKTLSRLTITRFQAFSLALCSVALYLPSLGQKLEHAVKDYSAVLDCVNAYHLGSLVLLLMTLLLNVILMSVSKKQE